MIIVYIAIANLVALITGTILLLQGQPALVVLGTGVLSGVVAVFVLAALRALCTTRASRQSEHQ
jgi:predicted exporter